MNAEKITQRYRGSNESSKNELRDLARNLSPEIKATIIPDNLEEFRASLPRLDRNTLQQLKKVTSSPDTFAELVLEIFWGTVAPRVLKDGSSMAILPNLAPLSWSYANDGKIRSALFHNAVLSEIRKRPDSAP